MTMLHRPWHRTVGPLTVTETPATYQAYQILHVAFVLAPLLAGLDKFFHFLANWDVYLAPQIPAAIHMTTHQFMLGVGVVEIVAAAIVAIKPRIGGYVVALWLAGIIVNLLMLGKYFDVALRDFGLLLAAIALSRLSPATLRRTI